METKTESNLRGSLDNYLTALAQQYRQKAFASTLLMPEMPVVGKTGKYRIFGSEHMKVVDSKRGLGAPPKQTNREDWDEVPFELDEYSLETRLDYNEIEAASKVLKLETYTMKQNKRILDLGQEMAAATILQAQATYESTHYLACTTGGYFDTAAVDPIKTIDDAMQVVENDVNDRPNGVILGPNSFNAIKNHPLVKARIANSKTGVVTLDLLSELLSTDENKVTVRIGTGKYKTTGGVYTNIYGNTCIIGFNQSMATQVDEYEMAFAKMITRKGYPWVLIDDIKGGMFRDVIVTKQYKAVVTNKNAGFLIANTITP